MARNPDECCATRTSYDIVELCASSLHSRSTIGLEEEELTKPIEAAKAYEDESVMLKKMSTKMSCSDLRSEAHCTAPCIALTHAMLQPAYVHLWTTQAPAKYLWDSRQLILSGASHLQKRYNLCNDSCHDGAQWPGHATQPHSTT